MTLAKKTIIILCEDIRKEIGNRVSLIGILDDDIVLPAIPHIFPKLCLFAMLKDVNNKILPTNLDIQIVSPGTEPVKLGIGFAPPKQKGKPKNATIGIEFSPFQVQCAGETRIEIRISGQEKPVITHKVSFKTK